MLTVRPLSIDNLFADENIDELLDGYYAECGISYLLACGDGVRVDVYRQLEAAGALFALGAFEGETLIGALLVLVNTLPHYGARVAVTESYYVLPAHRGTGAGLRLLRLAEQVARENGAVGFFVSAPVDGRLAEVMPHQGYAPTNRVFFRSLA